METSQELSFPESDDDSDAVEDANVEDMLKSSTLWDKAVVAASKSSVSCYAKRSSCGTVIDSSTTTVDCMIYWPYLRLTPAPQQVAS